jgi:hypothetical protein
MMPPRAAPMFIANRNTAKAASRCWLAATDRFVATESSSTAAAAGR